MWILLVLQLSLANAEGPADAPLVRLRRFWDDWLIVKRLVPSVLRYFLFRGIIVAHCILRRSCDRYSLDLCGYEIATHRAICEVISRFLLANYQVVAFGC